MLLCVQNEICGVLHPIWLSLKAHHVCWCPLALSFSCKGGFLRPFPPASPTAAIPTWITTQPSRELAEASACSQFLLGPDCFHGNTRSVVLLLLAAWSWVSHSPPWFQLHRHLGFYQLSVVHLLQATTVCPSSLPLVFTNQHLLICSDKLCCGSRSCLMM